MKERFKPISVLAFLACACVIGLGCDAGRGADEAPAPSTAPTADAHWQDVLKRLASADFAEREAAQNELDKASWREKEILKRLAATADDEEVKARILNRISEIDVQIACDPPPISVELKDATLEEVIKSLEMETGIRLRSGSMGGEPLRYTLSAHERPFWEVYRDLSRQHQLLLQGYESSGFLEVPQTLQNLGVQGPLAAYPITINRIKASNLQEAPGSEKQPEQFYLVYALGLDPRIAVLKSMEPEMLAVTDDLGNDLLEKTPPPSQFFDAKPASDLHVWQRSAILKLPPKLGGKITSAKGQIRIAVAIESEKVEISTVNKILNQKLAVAGKSITLTRWNEQPAQSQVDFEFGQFEEGLTTLGGQEVRGMYVTLIDGANGKRLATLNVQKGIGGNVKCQFTGPIKLELKVVTKVKELVLPFEMKDLALP